MNEQDRAIINQGGWFSSRSNELQLALLSSAKIIELNAADALFHRGEANSGLYAVLAGVMRVSGVNGEGKEAVLSFIDPAIWFGEVALFDGGLRTHDVYAQTQVRLLHIPHRALIQLLALNPIYWHDFGILLSQKIRLLFSSLEDHALLTAQQKVCKRLAMMAVAVPLSSNKATIMLSQQQLADMTYLTRQTINQILQILSEKKLISLHYQRIEILNKKELALLAH
ncbi:Crp/Fnr family transcriptional regulator [Pseudoalteromonas porphyrae]|uniref:Crp/Fnr family transcriptional regulator n=1 Tax=Pseudoalteromonas TaxID=53246 RepID=UPI0006BB2254|nr:MULTISPECIES: Crp/Fnr family transcriptional regulator [Pseudoalteromonas]KPH95108.1 Crp/Fnr family transcriptional regulator [Pseudoalteromonas porphyrae]NMR25970.1 Crp/Fnr family transcriptional regulator [Pseudoalteromonas sp. NEC-BIFX-2020_015]NNG43832.1 Crp/Fnr family transcriptional regulator [Pseudoalteromonas sp. NEC-BIFX-2020_002]